jgi:outer membrane beta-barrel protein
VPQPRLIDRLRSALAPALLAALVLAAASPALAYDKATDTNEVVLNKLFPKKGRVELDARLGVVLNSTFQQTFLGNAGITYFWSETWGFQLEGSAGLVSDKPERKCIETFYNDPNFGVSDECGDAAPVETDANGDPVPEADQDANYGPAYMPIRTLKYMVIGNFVWNPIYGKQIILLSATNYFDFYIGIGGGVAMSEFYPKTPEFEDGKKTRGTFPCTVENRKKGENCDKSQNPGTTDPNLTGDSGRPEPESQTHVLAHFSIGQRFHFLKRFMINASLENYTLLATESGFDNFLTIMGGVGVRF